MAPGKIRATNCLTACATRSGVLPETGLAANPGTACARSLRKIGRQEPLLEGSPAGGGEAACRSASRLHSFGIIIVSHRLFVILLMDP
jgi:hypothetical protein